MPAAAWSTAADYAMVVTPMTLYGLSQICGFAGWARGRLA
jgi:hypothetical protein